ncbi:MAG: hypothetical protein BIFFINMI_01721 [Phycisphaerae bacterium]|nr:hypothetical protein [Phycisphaerae bacterium]
MDQIRELIFGSPWPVIVGTVIIALPLLWLARSAVKLMILVLLLAGLIVGGLLVADRYVVTDAEQIEALARELVDLARDKQIDALGERMSSDFVLKINGVPLFPDRETTLRRLRLILPAFKFQSADISKLTVLADRSGAGSASLNVQVKGSRILAGEFNSDAAWHFTFAHSSEKGRWLITSADLTRLDGDKPSAGIFDFLQ